VVWHPQAKLGDGESVVGFGASERPRPETIPIPMTSGISTEPVVQGL